MAVSVGKLTVLVGETSVSVGGIVGLGLVVAGVQAANRTEKNSKMDTNLFIGVLLMGRSRNQIETGMKDYIL
jgi:hypothetical protein